MNTLVSRGFRNSEVLLYVVAFLKVLPESAQTLNLTPWLATGPPQKSYRIAQTNDITMTCTKIFLYIHFIMNHSSTMLQQLSIITVATVCTVHVCSRILAFIFKHGIEHAQCKQAACVVIADDKRAHEGVEEQSMHDWDAMTTLLESLQRKTAQWHSEES